MYSLNELGWCEYFSKQLEANQHDAKQVAARVAEDNRTIYTIVSAAGEFLSELSGKFRHHVLGRADLPVVGDWVIASLREDQRRATIHRVLDRKSRFSRKTAGRTTEEQIVAANVDVVFLVSSLNREFNARRIERYLALAWESGARPVLLLTKADLCEEPAEAAAGIERVAPAVSVHVVSALEGRGLGELAAYFEPGQTCVLLGPSGAGKSTLVNRLLGEERQEVREIRSYDNRGRHTTTSRQLVFLPDGGMLIDTPGMRELQLWGADEALGQTFGDVEEAAKRCRFTDCGHHPGTPGCGIQAAIDSGALPAERVASWSKLGRERTFLDRRKDQKAQSEYEKKLRPVTLARRTVNLGKEWGDL